MENKTVLEQAIAEILQLRKILETKHKEANDYTTKAILDYEMKGLTDSVRVLQKLLPTEKQQIVDAVTYGNRQDAYDGTETLGETYYQETYKKEK